jgi:hypothetical protein
MRGRNDRMNKMWALLLLFLIMGTVMALTPSQMLTQNNPAPTKVEIRGANFTVLKQIRDTMQPLEPHNLAPNDWNSSYRKQIFDSNGTSLTLWDVILKNITPTGAGWQVGSGQLPANILWGMTPGTVPNQTVSTNITNTTSTKPLGGYVNVFG